MRFLIVAAFFAYAAAAPKPGVLAPYEAQVAAHSLAPAAPTISVGDINGAAIDAHVEATDHFRAAVDADRQVIDKVSEIHGQEVNYAEEQAWRHVDNVKTIEAKLDGAIAANAPKIAKEIVRGSLPAPGPYAAPVAPRVAPVAPRVAPVAPVAPIAPVAPAAPAPATYAAPAPYAAPAAYQMTYEAPVAAPIQYAMPYAAPVEYAAPFATPYATYPGFENYGFAGPLNYAQPW